MNSAFRQINLLINIDDFDGQIDPICERSIQPRISCKQTETTLIIRKHDWRRSLTSQQTLLDRSNITPHPMLLTNLRHRRKIIDIEASVFQLLELLRSKMLEWCVIIAS